MVGADIGFQFLSCVQLDVSRARTKFGALELNTRRQIPNLQATMSYFVYYLNTIGLYLQVKSTLLTNEKNRIFHPIKKS